MSYEVNITIWCDADECERRVERQKRNTGGANKSWAADLAKGIDGWDINGRDPIDAYCPDHRRVGK